jgi:peptide/nickel transport system permease protein
MNVFAGGTPRGRARTIRGTGKALAIVVRQRKAATFGAALLAVFVLVAIGAPLLEPYGLSTQVGPAFGHPSSAHLLGLDDGGIDMLSLVIGGARVSMLVAVLATLLATVIGAGVGVTAGYFGGRTDWALMRVTDYFIVVPVLPLMIVIAAIWGPSLSHAILLIGLLSWTPTARVMRSQVLTTRERAYVKRARAMGAGHSRVIWYHVMPQVRGLLVANAVLTMAAAIFFEAALAFLGLESVTTVSWGVEIANAFNRAALSSGAWWAIVPPGLCIALVILACSLISISLEDAGNPRILAPHLYRGKLKVVSSPHG